MGATLATEVLSLWVHTCSLCQPTLELSCPVALLRRGHEQPACCGMACGSAEPASADTSGQGKVLDAVSSQQETPAHRCKTEKRASGPFPRAPGLREEESHQYSKRICQCTLPPSVTAQKCLPLCLSCTHVHSSTRRETHRSIHAHTHMVTQATLLPRSSARSPNR